MSIVVVERSFPEPVRFDDLQAIEDRGAWCLAAHGVRFLRSYFSRDRRRMVCLYEAPDAESVRLAQQKATLPFDAAWTARSLRHAAAEAESDAIVVERSFPEPLDEAAIREAAAQGSWCLEQYGCRIVWSYLSLDGRKAACVFGGPDAESVRQSQRRAGMPFDRAWSATLQQRSATP
jgi:hypothetical protein